MRFLIFFLVALLWATSSHAGAQAPSVKTNNGKAFLMCDNETTAGVCDRGTGDTFAIVSNFTHLTFIFHESSGTATCSANGIGNWDKDGVPVNLINEADLSALEEGDDLFTTDLSTTQQVITLQDIDLYAVWVTCAGGTINATVELRGTKTFRDN